MQPSNQISTRPIDENLEGLVASLADYVSATNDPTATLRQALRLLAFNVWEVDVVGEAFMKSRSLTVLADDCRPSIG
jgi:hypothetical protein